MPKSRKEGQLFQKEALRWHAHELKLSATEILGPSPPFFSQIDRRYRWQIVVRAPDPRRLLAEFVVPHGWMVKIDPVREFWLGAWHVSCACHLAGRIKAYKSLT